MEPDNREQTNGMAGLAIVLGVLPLITWPACSIENGTGIVVWGLSCVAALVGLGLGIAARKRGRTRAVRAAIWLGALAPIVSAALGLWMGLSNLSFTHGRPLRRRGRARVPETADAPDWVTAGARIAAPREVAEGWRVNAAMEAASIAAFAHLANDLLAIGAPAPLVAKAFDDAQDEIRHAQLCYGLAAAIDGRALGAGPFPEAAWPGEGAPDVASVARASLVEACVLESASARVAAALEQRSDLPPPIRALLATIAVDEARHAEHGWEILDWCLARAPGLADDSLRRALTSVSPARVGAAAADARHECYGLAGPELWAACVRAAVEEATARLARSSPAIGVASGQRLETAEPLPRISRSALRT
jgi:hypothetical protein